MIDTLREIAVRIRLLRYVAMVLGVACLAALAIIVLGTPASGEHNRYLVPAIVGFIWCLSAYGFIDTFQYVPDRANRRQGFLFRLKLYLLRGWFWMLAVLFAGSTLAALFLTFRLGLFWADKWQG